MLLLHAVVRNKKTVLPKMGKTAGSQNFGELVKGALATVVTVSG